MHEKTNIDLSKLPHGIKLEVSREDLEVFARKIAYEVLEHAKSLNQCKEYMNVPELASFLDFSESKIYKLTSQEKIPYHKPNGGSVIFKRSEIIEWVEKEH